MLNTCGRLVKDDLGGFARSIDRGGRDLDLGENEVSMLGSSRTSAIHCESFKPKSSDFGLFCFDFDSVGVLIGNVAGGGDEDFFDTQLGVLSFC